MQTVARVARVARTVVVVVVVCVCVTHCPIIPPRLAPTICARSHLRWSINASASLAIPVEVSRRVA